MSDLADYRHSAATRELLRSLANIVCPPEQAHLDTVEALLDEMELSMRSLPALVRFGLISGMKSYDLGAIARYGRRAGKLRDERALAYFTFWKSGLGLQRAFIQGLKGLMAMSYYELPVVLQDIGYTPQQWIDKVTKRRLDTYSDDIAKHEATVFERDPIPLPSEVEKRTEGSVQISSKKEASR